MIYFSHAEAAPRIRDCLRTLKVRHPPGDYADRLPPDAKVEILVSQ